jgi:transposase
VRLDGTEIQVRRPRANRPGRRAFVSGKKKPIPRVRGVRGRPTHRPRQIYADRGYDHDKYRRLVRARGITPRIARRGAGLGKHRWYVERTIAWLHAFKKLRLRTERRADVHQALISVACSVICLRQLIPN